MKLEFQSKRLHFRPLVEGDIDIELALWTDPEVVRFIAGEVSTVEEIRELMPVVTKRAGSGCIGIWCLIEKTTNEKIGHAALLPLPTDAEDTEFEMLQSDQWPDRDIEIGFVLKRSTWGAGYATEACARLVEFAFLEASVETIYATTNHQNLASQNVLKKCGFQDLGLIRAFAGHYPGFKIERQNY
ncbi:GNAT family N-acetyltransferase [Ruegeria denitrificans]|nr:GNAT family N-acetyltransferase [Ruegeria denitrificans]